MGGAAEQLPWGGVGWCCCLGKSDVDVDVDKMKGQETDIFVGKCRFDFSNYSACHTSSHQPRNCPLSCIPACPTRRVTEYRSLKAASPSCFQTLPPALTLHGIRNPQQVWTCAGRAACFRTKGECRRGQPIEISTAMLTTRLELGVMLLMDHSSPTMKGVGYPIDSVEIGPMRRERGRHMPDLRD